jgi:hypothetical protein
MLAVGIVNVGLHRIINRVAFQALSTSDAQTASDFYYNYASSRHGPSFRPGLSDPILIRSRLKSASVGCFDQIVQLAVATAASNPHALAILDHLASNVIWAIGTYLPRRITHTLRGRQPLAPQTPCDVRSNVRTLVSRLAALGTPCELSITERRVDGSTTELTFTIPPRRR